MASPILRGGNSMLHLLRAVSLVLFAALGTVILMREAPGYFTDVRETDPRYSEQARTRLAVERQEQSSILKMCEATLNQWLHGDLGRSREYDVPVTTLLAARSAVSGKLLFRAVAVAWLCSLALALPLAARRGRRGEALIAAPIALLLAVPTGALATLCLMLDSGGPLLVLATIVAVRDFKLVYRLLRQSLGDPCMLHARAQGISTLRILLVYLLPRLRTRLVSLASMSFVLALSALVPVEVIFNLPGLGQLAFAAAMNRDLPVLLAVTMVMAACVAAAGVAGASMRESGLQSSSRSFSQSSSQTSTMQTAELA
jgi:peptide/nickel transport system permease protein